jgi:hypothetical protein
VGRGVVVGESDGAAYERNMPLRFMAGWSEFRGLGEIMSVE